VISPWFVDIANYLVVGTFLPNQSSKEKINIVRKSAPFTWIGGNLFIFGPDHIVRKCVREEEVFDMLSACHDGPCGGHFVAKRKTFKVIQSGYYWSTYIKMQGGTPPCVINAKGWVSKYQRIKFPYNFK